MSTSLSLERATTWKTWCSDVVDLSKPRIAVMVLVTVSVSAYVASLGYMDWLRLVHTLIGTILIATSATILNQWLEIDTDSRMERTHKRPLVTGNVSARQALFIGSSMFTVGIAYVLVLVGMSTAIYGFLTWGLYVWLYTPLKRRTSANTAVGAVAGALPMLIGWSVSGRSVDLQGASLFLILFLWQFPHFMAIAWLYRRQYGQAGLKMLTVVDPSGRRAGVQAVLGALAVMLTSLVPAMVAPGQGAAIYLVAAFILGAIQLACAIGFFIRRDELAARRLLRCSLIYLPLLLAFMLLIPLI